MTNFPNLKPTIGKDDHNFKMPKPEVTKTKAQIIKEATEIIESARAIRESYATNNPGVFRYSY